MRADIVAGAVLPDYELTDHTAKRRKLSNLQGQHPMVLVLSRGGFCPKDRRQAELLVQLHRELEVSYCRLVTISTDDSPLHKDDPKESLRKFQPHGENRGDKRSCQRCPFPGARRSNNRGNTPCGWWCSRWPLVAAPGVPQLRPPPNSPAKSSPSNRRRIATESFIAASRTPLSFLAGWECRGRRLS